MLSMPRDDDASETVETSFGFVVHSLFDEVGEESLDGSLRQNFQSFHSRRRLTTSEGSSARIELGFMIRSIVTCPGSLFRNKPRSKRGRVGITIFLNMMCLSIWLSPICFGQSNSESKLIHINQLGYLPAAQKIALVSSPVGLPFQLTETRQKIPVFKGMLELSEPRDAASGSDLWVADFSILTATGEFVLSIPGIGESHPFAIHDTVYSSLPRVLIRGFMLQRCGMPVSRKYAGDWSKSACHLNDGYLYSASSEQETILSATGGWHEGSSYDKYIASGVYSSAMLMLVYELDSERFRDDSLQIPESGNGIPDILDEIKIELDWLLSMQDKTTGGFYHKLTPKEPIHATAPEKDQSKRYIFDVSTAATASSCALLAKAYRLYRPFLPEFAQACLDASKRAWQYLMEHPDTVGFENPEGIMTKAYRDTDDSDERFWAAIELLLATQDPRFQDIALEIEEHRVPLLSSAGYWANVMPLAVASMLNSASFDIHKKIKTVAESDLISLANILYEKKQKDGYRVTLQEGEFTWGSNGSILQNSFIFCLTHALTGKNAYLDAALDQLHYLLGRNPLSICYITGMGYRSPQNPHHLFSMIDKIANPVPGLVVAGPNQSINDEALKKNFTSTTAPMLTYLDSEESYTSNETNLIWTSVCAYVSAYLTQ